MILTPNKKPEKIYLQYARNVMYEHDREHFADINKRQQLRYSILKGSPQQHKVNEKKRQRGKEKHLSIDLCINLRL